ncbi:hypothetical protein [Paraburkholderia heleia]|uniref:hypothetical protein n=1 Tax=Paraburkholderia heleia TaxID=634127 RepID=UPI002AB7C46E|nr:hypothetical protein [Paraburkholderia heleia]
MSKLKVPRVPDASQVQMRIIPVQQSYSDALASVEHRCGEIWMRAMQGQYTSAEKEAARIEVLKLLFLE